MTVLGYEVENAKRLLSEAGFSVVTKEVRSKTGVVGNEKRVVRQQFLESAGEGKTVCLTYAIFRTSIV